MFFSGLFATPLPFILLAVFYLYGAVSCFCEKDAAPTFSKNTQEKTYLLNEHSGHIVSSDHFGIEKEQKSPKIIDYFSQSGISLLIKIHKLKFVLEDPLYSQKVCSGKVFIRPPPFV